MCDTDVVRWGGVIRRRRVVRRRGVVRRVVRRGVVRRRVVRRAIRHDANTTQRGHATALVRATVHVRRAACVAARAERDPAVAIGHIGGDLDLAVGAGHRVVVVRGWGVVRAACRGGQRQAHTQRERLKFRVLEDHEKAS